MKYKDYQLEDFVLDEDFQQWVKHPQKKQSILWEKITLEYPEKQELVGEAQKLILALQFKKNNPTQTDYDQILENILKARKIQPTRKIKTKSVFSYYLVAVAIGILLLSAGVYYFTFYQQIQNIVEQTAYGETKELQLPDGTTVYLNANSKISYQANFDAVTQREVWLEGEAYFKVQKSKKHDQSAKKFIVHTQNLDVVVWGTQFNVNNHDDMTQVVLNTGAVTLQLKNPKKKQEIKMKPGEMVEFSSKSQLLTQKTIQKDIYSTWIKKRFVFENVPLCEVALRLEDFFGLQVQFEDEDLKQLRFTGTPPMNDIDLLISILNQSLEIKIEKKNQTIYIQR
jgi:transmembrane sensor